MIFSRLHRLLFIKGRKVASTSFEVALSKICGPNDIITPITPIDEKIRLANGYRNAQNYGADDHKLRSYIETLRSASPETLQQLKPPRGRFANHTTLREAHSLLGEELKGIRIMAIVRSPYQTILSRLNHRVSFADYKSTGRAMQATLKDLSNELQIFLENLDTCSHHKNLSHYMPTPDVELPAVEYLRFEKLQEELNQLLNSLNITESIMLPHLKKGKNLPDKAILDIATPEQLAAINDYFDDEFKEFGYAKLSA